MSIREAFSLIVMLGRDSSSWTHAAVNKWRHPASREWQLFADLWDLTLMANSEKGSRSEYPRPWPKQSSALGANSALHPEKALALLHSMILKGA